MKKNLALCALMAFLFPLRWGVCEEIPASFSVKRKASVGYFGTVSFLTLYDDFTLPENLIRYDAVWEEIKALLEQMDNLLSTSIETSEIAQFNRLKSGESMPISDLTAAVFLEAQRMYEQTDGYFNPAIFPLVDLWGFSPRFLSGGGTSMPYDRAYENGTRPAPDPAYIRAFLELADMDGIRLEGDAQSGYVLSKTTPAVCVEGVEYNAQIDLGGIAKGYAVDRVIELLGERGYEYGYFSCGTSSIGFLKSASASSKEENDPSFSLAIRSPREGQSDSFATVRLFNQALSSSGDYENNYVLDGQILCHIIDPHTGYPLNYSPGSTQQGICTITLLSGSATEDDALTTALCLMGPAGALRYFNEHLTDRGIVITLYKEGESTYEVLTNLPQAQIALSDPAYQIVSTLTPEGEMRYGGTLFETLP